MLKIKYEIDLDEKRAMGLISDEAYYMLKKQEAWGDYNAQRKLFNLKYLEDRKKKQEQTKAQISEKEIKEIAEKEIAKQIENIFKNI